MANEAWLKSTIDGRRLVLAAAGSWTATHAREIEPLVNAAVPDKSKIDQVDIDLAHIDHIDTFGAWLVERLRRSATASGVKAAIVGLDTRFKILFDEVAASNKKGAWRPLREKPLVESLMHIGKSVIVHAGRLRRHDQFSRRDRGGVRARGAETLEIPLHRRSSTRSISSAFARCRSSC